jgi:hypothetical protein
MLDSCANDCSIHVLAELNVNAFDYKHDNEQAS